MTLSSPPLASQWAGDAAWQAMDASARAFHTQLMLIAAQGEPAGTLVDDDARWRRWVGVPEAADEEPASSMDQAVSRLMTHSLKTGQGLNVPEALVLALHPQAKSWREGQGNWMDHLWRQRWKPMLLAAWPVITRATVAKHPHLAGCEGLRFCEMAMRLAQPISAAGVPPAAVAARPGSVTAAAGGVGQQAPAKLEPGKRAPPKRGGRVPADPLLLDLLASTPQTDGLMDADHVLRCFQAVALPHQRQSLWDLGIQVLGQEAKPATVRAYLGKLIKEYGEKEVGAALGEVAARAMAPAEVKSFLKGVLDRNKFGSKGEQVAKEQRMRVLL